MKNNGRPKAYVLLYVSRYLIMMLAEVNKRRLYNRYEYLYELVINVLFLELFIKEYDFYVSRKRNVISSYGYDFEFTLPSNSLPTVFDSTARKKIGNSIYDSTEPINISL